MNLNNFNGLEVMEEIQLEDDEGYGYKANSTLRNVGIGEVTKFVTRNRGCVLKKNEFLLREDHIFPSGDAKTGN